MDLLYKVRLYQENGHYFAVLVASGTLHSSTGRNIAEALKTWGGPWPITLRPHRLIAQ